MTSPHQASVAIPFAKRRAALWMSALLRLGVALALVAGLAVTVFLPTTPPTPMTLGIAMGFFGLAFLFGMGAQSRLRRAFDPTEVELSVGPEGILDRRLSSRVIPWDAIEAVVPQGLLRKTLALELTPEAIVSLRLVPMAKVAATFGGLVGQSGLSLATYETRATMAEVAKSIERFRPGLVTDGSAMTGGAPSPKIPA
ncbi:MAG: hypothetical protein WCH83_12315 [Alphaproteobacteria bacterium]